MAENSVDGARTRGLLLTPADFTVTVGEAAEEYSGRLSVRAPKGRHLRGEATSDSERLKLDAEKLDDANHVIRFRVSLKGIGPGEAARCHIIVATPYGEAKVPVWITKEPKETPHAMGRGITDLKSFTALAKKSYDEAFRLFSVNSFEDVIKNEDKRVEALYRALSAPPVSYHRMEEFLVALGLKEPVYVSAESESASFFEMKESRQESITLRRSSWGSLKIEASCSASFIELPKSRVLSEDFNGSICEFPYVIRRDKLASGRNFAVITLKSFHSTIRFSVTASCDGEMEIDSDSAGRRNRLRLAESYIKYRSGRITAQRLRAETAQRLYIMRQLGDADVMLRLYETYIEYISGRQEEASKLMVGLSSYDFENEAPKARAAFMYLGLSMGFIEGEQAENAVRCISEFYKREREDVLLQLLTLRTDPTLQGTSDKKLRFMERCFALGNFSPYLYLDALDLLTEDEAALKQLTPFMMQVIRYGIRLGTISAGLAERAACLADNAKSFSQPLFGILCGLYGLYPTDSILTAVCKLIMKGTPGRREYFRWYAAAIERDLRITRLYEYYMETLPSGYQKVLPVQVRRYFLMRTDLPREKLAMLYANIIANRGSDPVTYDDYRPVMEKFAQSSIRQGKMNRDYAVIYREFFHRLPDGVVGEKLCEAIFTEMVYTDDPRVRNVIVCHPELSGEESVGVHDGEAYVKVYSPNACIVLSDGKSHRYFNAALYAVEPLMPREEILAGAWQRSIRSPGYILRQIMQSGKVAKADEGNLFAFIRAAGSQDYTEELKRSVRREIVEYALDAEKNEAAASFLAGARAEDFDPGDREKLLRAFVKYGYAGKAYSFVKSQGAEKIPGELALPLIRLIDGDESLGGAEVEGVLRETAFSAFKKERSDALSLEVLADGFEGGLDDLRSIRSAAKEKNLEVPQLDERILRRLCMTGQCAPEGGELIESVSAMEGKQRLAERYVVLESESCFARGEAISPQSAKVIEEAVNAGYKPDRICRLALLYYYSEKESLSEEEEQAAEKILDDCMVNEIRFGFFKKLPKSLRRQYQLDDRAFVEYHGKKGSSVTLSYTLKNAGGELSAREPVREMYEGWYVREFVLFYGEELTYSFTEDDGSETVTTEAKSIVSEKAGAEDVSLYGRLNRLLKLKGEGRREAFEEQIRDLKQADKVAKALFSYKEEP